MSPIPAVMRVVFKAFAFQHTNGFSKCGAAYYFDWTVMKVNRTLVCRSNEMIYEKLHITNMMPNATRVGTLFRHSNDNIAPIIPARIVQLWRRNDECSVVAIYPDIQNRKKVGIAIGEFDKDNTLISEEIHLVSPHKMKWESRLNYRIQRSACKEIKGIDERSPELLQPEIHISNIIQDGMDLLIRGTISHSFESLMSFRVACYDSSFSLLSDSFINMGEVLGEDSNALTLVSYSMTFSMRIPDSHHNLIIVSWNESNPEHPCWCLLPFREQPSLRMPYDYYLYEDAGVSPYYNSWLLDNRATPNQLEVQRHKSLRDSGSTFIIFILSNENAGPGHLSATVDSLLRQSYKYWIAYYVQVGRLAKALPYTDGRIQSVCVEELNLSTLVALTGENADQNIFYSFIKAGDLFEPDALFSVNSVVATSNDLLVYSDEDTILSTGEYCKPIFKPKYDIELQLCEDYISQSMFVRLPALLEFTTESAYTHSDLRGELYNLSLQFAWRSDLVTHIASPMVHHLELEKSENGPHLLSYPNIVETYLHRRGIDSSVCENAGHAKVIYSPPLDAPLVSIIIPNKDQVEILKACLDSIREKTTYNYYEILIVENNSSQSETFEYYEKICNESDNVSVLYWKHEFNFSKLINYGRRHAHGEYLVLLNNDTKIITNDWLQIMLGVCSQKDVGVVGAKLYYPDDTIQHAGVCVANGAGHQFTNLPRNQKSYLDLANVQRSVSAVTAACMMTRADVFDLVGGFDEMLQVAFNDVDYCLGVNAAGYRVVFSPYVELYHYESISRGRDDNPKDLVRRIRSTREWSMLILKWAEEIITGDPHFSPNLRDGHPDCCYYLLK